MNEFGIETKADPQELELLRKIGEALVVLHNDIKELKEKRVESLPPVIVESLPAVRVKNLQDLKPYFEMVEKATKHLAVAITLMSSKMEPVEKSK